MKTKIFIVILALVFFVQWTCSFTIGGGDDTETVKLWVPYYEQECPNWCGPACIQMWTDMTGKFVTQFEIAETVGALGASKAHPDLLAIGTSIYTCTEGWLEFKPWYEPGSKGDLIAATITGVENGVPSIMPFNVEHAVLMVGYKWRVEDNGKPVAISGWYHDPAIGENRSVSASLLNVYFDCTPANNWVIVGFREFIWEGIDGHAAFIEAGGTYYGGPDVYDPDDIVAQQ